ncbi:hypothetical protein ACQKQA_20985, partial [Pseudomonas sp. NPDC089530]|uniref:hypothetical protein n=1 Tax=Pseudomonas sp. NPDC089530 TaxID=3390651 RepID=UPI003CFC9A83
MPDEIRKVIGRIENNFGSAKSRVFQVEEGGVRGGLIAGKPRSYRYRIASVGARNYDDESGLTDTIT